MNGSKALTQAVAVALVATAALEGVASAQQAGATTTTQRERTAQALRGLSRDDRVRPQGFSVVLVLADLQTGSGDEHVPPAARKALADMKDFLPYRSYRLLDAAWILCCGSGRSVTRLRGPDDRDYEVELISSVADEGRTAVQFALRDLSATVQDSTPRASGQAGSPSRIAEQERRSEAARAQIAAAHGPRSVMNTSFTMDLGETVVVGTSRLSGNSKALIALLTAVPPKSSRR
jgi:hypothetical protein